MIENDPETSKGSPSETIAYADLTTPNQRALQGAGGMTRGDWASLAAKLMGLYLILQSILTLRVNPQGHRFAPRR